MAIESESAKKIKLETSPPGGTLAVSEEKTETILTDDTFVERARKHCVGCCVEPECHLWRGMDWTLVDGKWVAHEAGKKFFESERELLAPRTGLSCLAYRKSFRYFMWPCGCEPLAQEPTEPLHDVQADGRRKSSDEPRPPNPPVLPDDALSLSQHFFEDERLLQVALEQLNEMLPTKEEKPPLLRQLTALQARKFLTPLHFVPQNIRARHWKDANNDAETARSMKNDFLEWLCMVQKQSKADKTDEDKAKTKALIETIEGHLDTLDELEEFFLKIVYQMFRILIGLEFNNSPFSKQLVDQQMEDVFGSLNSCPEESPSVLDATKLFSDYLSRKAWVPMKWRALSESVPKFMDRVVNNPILRDVDEEALEMVETLARTIAAQATPEDLEERFVERTPRASCLENQYALGGKRVAMLSTPKPERGRVKPVAVYTGGKIRVITIDSYTSVNELSWVNKVAGRIIRKCHCSIFGSPVERWTERNEKTFKRYFEGKRRDGQDSIGIKGQRYFISGDLESATDNFDGRLTDAVIDIWAEAWGFDGEWAKDITTRANLGTKKRPIQQTRGQLMGSVLSFPILCLISMATCLMAIPKGLEIAGDWDKLRKAKGFGVNGDDVVLVGTEKIQKKWESAVEKVGGVISRGKTLKSKEYFTVNSELWHWTGEEALFCPAIRPSILTAFVKNRKKPINADANWLEYHESPLLNEHALRVFNVDQILKADLPVSLGGLGLVNDFNMERYLEALKLTSAAKPIRLFSEAWKAEQPEYPEPTCIGWCDPEVKKESSKLYETKKANFQMTHESFLPIVRAAKMRLLFDYYPGCVDWIKPFLGQLRKGVTASRSEVPVIEQRDGESREKAAKRDYELRFIFQRCRVPVGWGNERGVMNVERLDIEEAGILFEKDLPEQFLLHGR